MFPTVSSGYNAQIYNINNKLCSRAGLISNVLIKWNVRNVNYKVMYNLKIYNFQKAILYCELYIIL